ncbi:hypothetical protein [Undibacterium sp. TJN19]|uniref:hypothetical protein n=1 Tax=Undibacterium sp. TJN19 TaxID=3413055 RepID=UPI003BF1D8EE
MHFSGRSKLPTPARSLSLLLVLLTHLVVWQLVRHQIWDRSNKPENDLVQYLQLLAIPKPAPAKPVSVSIPTSAPVSTQLPTAVSTEKLTPAAKRQPAQEITDKTTNDHPASTQTSAEAEPISPPAPSETDSKTSPSLDLDSLRSAALTLDRQRKPGEIEQIQASHWRRDTMEKRLGEGTKRAGKKECIKAFSGLGLLAVIPLAVSAVVDTGCKW